MSSLRRAAQRHATPWRWPLLVACALTVLMLGVTALYWQAQQRQVASQVAHDFERTVDRIAQNIDNRMDAYELVLRGVKGFFDGSKNISQDELATYVDTLSLEDTKPGLQGISLIRWLDASDPQHQQTPQQSLPPHLFPSGTRSHYALMTYIEPLTPENQKVLGFDIATHAPSWEALELSRDNGQPALTRKLVLAQDSSIDMDAGTAAADPALSALAMYLPLYAPGALAETPAQRRAALRGWVSVQFRMQTLMQGLTHRLDSDIDLRIYDKAAKAALDAQGLLYSTLDAPDKSDNPAYQPPPELQTTRELLLGGRTWTLLLQPRANFVAEHGRSAHHSIAVMGAIGSVLLGLLAWLLLTVRERGIALARNIAEHKLAYYDALTALPNRALLKERVHSALLHHQRLGHMGALIALDLDNFKQINDARGHAVGDMLLIQVAERLSRLLRSGDTLARLGGDEFVLVLHDITRDMDSRKATAAALRLGDQVRSVLEAPHQLGDDHYTGSASIGITLFPKQQEHVDSESADDLLREADTAMSLAKKMEHNRMCLFEGSMLTDAQESLSLEQDVKNALERGEISLCVQSQVDASNTQNVIGGELLLRWNHPLRGSVSPDRFISVAEESDLILRLGDWVIVQACQALVHLQATRPQLSLSVNVSPRQFHQDDFVGRIRTILRDTGAPPTQLILEITEALLVDSRDTIARMTELVGMGIRFSIDDFGTGYSSLSYLKKMPLYELKIDKSFVNDIPQDPDDTAIVQAILAMARHLNLRVVAEGIETQEQADFLQAHHCNDLQGYLFERPMLMQSWLDKLDQQLPKSKSKGK